MKLIKTSIAAALFAVSTLSQAAIVVATDDFQSYTTGNLNAQNGGSGWAGAWTATSSAESVVDPVIDLQGNRALQFGSTETNAAVRRLSVSQTGDVLVDFQIQISGALERNDFVSLWFGSSTGPNIGLKGNEDSPSGTNDIFARTNGTGGAFAPNSNLAANVTYHIFGHLYKSVDGGSYNRFALWLDPTAAEMANLTGADALYSGTSNIASFDTIGFRAANLNNGVTVRVDSLRIQNIPEPTSIALLGLAMFGAAGVSYRRKAPN